MLLQSSGTPLQNNLHELWALLNFILPDVFGDAEKFDQWFKAEDGAVQTEMVGKLHGILKPFMIRRLKADVEKSLLPKIETKVYVGLSEMQVSWYKKVRASLAMCIDDCTWLVRASVVMCIDDCTWLARASVAMYNGPCLCIRKQRLWGKVGLV